MNKLAKLKYLPNNFEIMEEGDHVICAISGKKIPLEKLNYWNGSTKNWENFNAQKLNFQQT